MNGHIVRKLNVIDEPEGLEFWIVDKTKKVMRMIWYIINM